jgi:hypothetical protein
MQNYFKSTLENLTKYLAFKHPKMASYFWTKPFRACKKRKNKTKSRWNGTRIFGALKTGLKLKNVAVFPKVNNQRWPKILKKLLIFIYLKSTQIFIEHQKLSTRKNH